MTTYNPNVNDKCLYKERGGKNWFNCSIIAYHGNQAWLHNLETNSKPIKKLVEIEFKPIPSFDNKATEELAEFIRYNPEISNSTSYKNAGKIARVLVQSGWYRKEKK